VEWGDGSGDEMCLMSVFMTQPKEGVDYSYAPTVYLEAPTFRQRFAAGDLVPLRLIVNNFNLHDPGEHDDSAGAHNSGHSEVYEGHYHVYLDSDDDAAEHLTAWDDSYFYQLPKGLTSGMHTLRVSLRGADHHALGIEQTVKIEVREASTTNTASLVDADNWAVQVSADDKLSSHRPAKVDCPASSWGNEDGALEVETGYCNYLSLNQAGKVAVEAGNSLHIVLWHGDLAFEESALAHVAVSVAGEVVWEKEVEIPTKAEIYDLRIPLRFDAPTGSPVELHLHNHGYNSWTLLKLEVER